VSLTLATVGYGDVTQPRPGRHLAWLEAVTGQLYLAITVASWWRCRSPREAPGFRLRETDRYGSDSRPANGDAGDRPPGALRAYSGRTWSVLTTRPTPRTPRDSASARSFASADSTVPLR
jgi:Ion channel